MAQTVRGVTFNKSYVVSGVTGMAAHGAGVYAFLNAEQGHYLIVNGIIMTGSYIQTVVTSTAASYRYLTVIDRKTVDGYSDIPAYISKQLHNVERYTCILPDVAGSRGGNAALADLLTQLAALGLIRDTTS